MSRFWFPITLLVLLQCAAGVCLAQSGMSLSDYAFPCDALTGNSTDGDPSAPLSYELVIEESEGEYLLVNHPEYKSLQGFLTSLQKNDKSFVVLAVQGQYGKDEISKALHDFLGNEVYIVANDSWPSIDFLQEKRGCVVVVLQDHLTNTTIQQLREGRRYEERFSEDPLGRLVVFYSEQNTQKGLLSECYELWQHTGKVPNFIVAPNIGIAGIGSVSDSLNSKRRFRGVVHYQGELLNQIYWYQSTGVITPARFSFPLLDDEQILLPYKNGYRITPSEVIHHPAMVDDPRLFTAFDIPLDDKLVYDFGFEEDAKNELEPEWESSIVKDVIFGKDAQRGNVLHLQSPNSFIDYSKENTLSFDTPITVAMWVKADTLLDYMGMIGIGSAFSLKIKDGYLDFTTATIKDHINDTRLSTDRWYHIAVVFNPGSVVEFFIDGQKVGESLTSEIKPSNQSLVIGNNIWGEQFYGAIDALKVWDRGLSPREIAVLFQEVDTPETDIYLIWGALIVLAFFVYAFGKKKMMKKKPARVVLHSTPDEFAVEQTKNALLLFGSFHVKVEKEGDITAGFSPLLRQILSFLILQTVETGVGITTNKLTETFWPGLPKDKAKENRGANIKKLRKLLSDVEGMHIVFENQKWRVDTSADFYIDVAHYARLKKQVEVMFQSHICEQGVIQQLLQLLQKGNILQNIHTDWVDYYKNKISSEVDGLLSEVYTRYHSELGSETNILLANTILLFDSLNEQALKIVIRELVNAGKHGQAQSAYSAFAKNYKALYDEPFTLEYQNIVEGIA